MKDEDLIEMARELVPEHARSTGRVLKPDEPLGRKLASAGLEKTVEQSLAEKVYVKYGKKKPRRAPERAAAEKGPSGDVVFTDSSTLGARPTVVRIRGGKVRSVLKLG